MDPSPARRLLVVALLVGAAGVVALSDVPTCPTAFFLGIPCPGCGLTRATVALLRGDVGGALRLHPLVLVVGPIFFGAIASSFYEYVRGERTRAPGKPSWWTTRAGVYGAALLLVLVLGVWGARFAGYFGGPVPIESFMAASAERTR